MNNKGFTSNSWFWKQGTADRQKEPMSAKDPMSAKEAMSERVGLGNTERKQGQHI